MIHFDEIGKGCGRRWCTALAIFLCAAVCFLGVLFIVAAGVQGIMNMRFQRYGLSPIMALKAYCIVLKNVPEYFARNPNLTVMLQYCTIVLQTVSLVVAFWLFLRFVWRIFTKRSLCHVDLVVVLFLALGWVVGLAMMRLFMIWNRFLF